MIQTVKSDPEMKGAGLYLNFRGLIFVIWFHLRAIFWLREIELWYLSRVMFNNISDKYPLLSMNWHQLQLKKIGFWRHSHLSVHQNNLCKSNSWKAINWLLNWNWFLFGKNVWVESKTDGNGDTVLMVREEGRGSNQPSMTKKNTSAKGGINLNLNFI